MRPEAEFNSSHEISGPRRYLLVILSILLATSVRGQWLEISGPSYNPGFYTCSWYYSGAIASNHQLYWAWTANCAAGAFGQFWEYEIFSSPNLGAGWTSRVSVNGVNMNILDMDFVDEATGYYVHSNDYLGCQAFRTDDQLMTKQLLPFAEAYDYGDLAMVSYDTLFMIDREARIFRFDGDSLQIICDLPVEIPLYTDKPDLYATDGQHLHLACRDLPQGEYMNDLILRSSDGGSTWDTTFLSATIHLNAIKLTQEGTGFAVGDAGSMLRTTDGGASWEELPVVTASDLLCLDFLNPQTWLVGGTEATLLYTEDAGITWEWLESPTSPKILKFPEKNYTVILRSNKFYRTNIKWITGTPAVSQKSGPFQLLPNPAGEQTTLSLSGMDNARGQVTLLNTLGEALLNLPLEGEKTPIDCSKLRSGLYFVAVEYDGNMQILKLMIRQGR